MPGRPGIVQEDYWPSRGVAHRINIRTVTTSARQALQAWKEAEASARLAEAELEAAWQRFFLRESSAPLEELMVEIRRRRANANELLAAAIAAVEGDKAPKRAGPQPVQPIRPPALQPSTGQDPASS